MVTVAAGMESDFSDDEANDIVFTSKVSNVDKLTRKKIDEPSQKPPTANGTAGIAVQSPLQSNFHSPSYGSKKGLPPERNRNRPMRRQVLDFKSSQLLDDLRYAIIQGNLETTKSIMSKGVYVDTVLRAEWTGLMYASSSGHPDIVLFLLESKANPNYHKDMFTSLMAVCASKKDEEDLLQCCVLLLKYGAKVDAHERHFTTPLMFAVREGYSLIVRELLENGANANLQDNRGKTALAWAASFGHGQIIRLLLEKGADSNIITSMGQSPIDLAYEHGFSEVVSLLEKCHLIKNGLSKETSLVPKTVPGIAQMSNSLNAKSNESKSYTKIGELELFLSGIDLADLVPMFTQQKINFENLLIMDDGELEKMGIGQIGARNKILEACKSVHKQEWKTSSLPNLKQSQYISCPDAVAMMANIAKHLKFISSSVIYVRQQINAHPKILELSQDSANIHNLMDEMDDSLKNVQSLQHEIKILKMHLERIQNSAQFNPADLIVDNNNTGKQLAYCSAIVVATTSIAVAGVFWMYPEFLGKIPIYIRIKIPFLS